MILRHSPRFVPLALMLALLLLPRTSLGLGSGPNPEVQVIGRLQDVMHGDASAKVRLDLLELKHLFALGPAAGKDGEIAVLDGIPYWARVNETGGATLENTRAIAAAMLVFAKVETWRESPLALSSPLGAEKDWATTIENAAVAQGLDIERAFPFRLSGDFSQVTFHILRHEDSQVRFEENAVQAEVIGFYSRHHEGVFTHKGSSIHFHFVSPPRGLAGHIDALLAKPGNAIRLLLPQAGPR
jgi:acetolactate decarboxylase